MLKTAILYRSPHHGNTKMLLHAIQKAHPEITFLHAGEDDFNPGEYDRIGFASGIYAGKMHRTVRKALDAADGAGKQAFVIYTCGDTAGDKYGERFAKTLSEKGFTVIGRFWCVGWDTFGPLKLVGGMHKGKPTAEDAQSALQFYESLGA